MAQPLDFSAMLSDPAFAEEFQRGYAKGEALAQSIKETPVQPEVTAEEIMPQKMSQAEMQQKMYQLMQKSMGGQSEQIEALKQAVAKEQARQEQAGVLGRLDLRPFAQAVRGYGATNVAIPTEAPEDRTEILRKLQKELTTAKGGLTGDQVAFLRTMMEDKKSAQAALSQGNQDIRVFQDVKRAYDKPAEDIQDFYQAHDAVKLALNSGDITAIQASLSNYARMSGEKGVLTDQDITRVMPNNLKQRAAKWWANVASDPTVEAPPEVIEALARGIDRLKQAAETKAKARFERVRSETEEGPGAYGKYSKTLYPKAIQVIRPSEAEAKGGAGMSEAQKKRLQELKAKYGK